MAEAANSTDHLDIDMYTQQACMLADEWKSLFDQYDEEGFGEIEMSSFHKILADPTFRAEVDEHKLDVLENIAMENGYSTITYQQFVNIMSNKRTQSFKLAVRCRDRDLDEPRWNRFPLYPHRQGCFHAMVRRLAKDFLTDDRDRQYYADNYSCCPPPLFIPTITLIEIAFFVYYAIEAGDVSLTGPVPAHSIFIYRPDKRIEIWRFLLYMFIHAGWVHLFFNMLIQIAVGVPLEMVHGSVRISTIYLMGVLAGSLGTSVFDKDAFLVGASGGVYALLAAHLANILLNFSEMELGIYKLGAVFIIASADVGFAIWDRYSSRDKNPPVGYVAHLTGALAGLTIGLIVLKNFEQKLHSQVMWWVALGIYGACMVFAIVWNVFH